MNHHNMNENTSTATDKDRGLDPKDNDDNGPDVGGQEDATSETTITEIDEDDQDKEDKKDNDDEDDSVDESMEDSGDDNDVDWDDSDDESMELNGGDNQIYHDDDDDEEEEDDDDEDEDEDEDDDESMEELNGENEAAGRGGGNQIADIGHVHRYESRYRPPAASSSQGDENEKKWQEGERARTKKRQDFKKFVEALVQTVEEAKNSDLHDKVKSAIHNCKERHQRFEPGYEYLPTSLRVELKKLLHAESADHYWQEAETACARAMQEEEEKRKKERQEEEERRRNIRWARDSGFDGSHWEYFRNRKGKDFHLVTEVLLAYLEQNEERYADELAKVHGILEDFENTRKAPIHEDEAIEKIEASLNAEIWGSVKETAGSFLDTLEQFNEQAPEIAESTKKAKAFLQSLPSDPAMSHIVLMRALKTVMGRDPKVEVVTLFDQEYETVTRFRLESKAGPQKLSLLHRAAGGGTSLQVIKYLCQKYPHQLETVDEKGRLPLHQFLCHHKYMKEENATKNVLEIVEFLVDAAPASLSTKNPNGELPLHLCFDLIESRNYSPSAFPVAAFLMERYPKALHEPGSFCGYIPLQHALWREAPLDLLTRMVELAPEVSRSKTDRRLGEYPMHTACEHGRIELARALLTKDSLKGCRGEKWTPLKLRSGSFVRRGGDLDKHQLKGFVSDVQALLEPEDFQEWLLTQVNCTAQAKSVADTKALLDASQPQVLSWVLTRRHSKSGALLIESEMAKCEAAVNTEQLKLLIQYAPQVLESIDPRFGQTPLHTAVTHDNKEAVRIVLSMGPADALSRRDKYGRTPLHVAVMAGASLGLLQILVDSYPGALWTPDNNGYTPLHHAFHVSPTKVGWWKPSCSCKKSRLSSAGIQYYLKLVEFLVCCHGKDARRALWMTDSSGRLPAHHAVVGHGKVVEYLLGEMRGDAESKSAVDSRGRNVLHVALEADASMKTLEVIMKYCNDLSVPMITQLDGEGRLPHQIACESACPTQVVYWLIRQAPLTVSQLANNGETSVSESKKQPKPKGPQVSRATMK